MHTISALLSHNRRANTTSCIPFLFCIAILGIDVIPGIGTLTAHHACCSCTAIPGIWAIPWTWALTPHHAHSFCTTIPGIGAIPWYSLIPLHIYLFWTTIAGIGVVAFHYYTAILGISSFPWIGVLTLLCTYLLFCAHFYHGDRSDNIASRIQFFALLSQE